MIRGRQCHVFVNCHNRSPSRRSTKCHSARVTWQVWFWCRPINISASFLFVIQCAAAWRDAAAQLWLPSSFLAAPSFINVHHLNVIRHPVALVRVDTIRLSSLNFKSWDRLDSTFEALKRLIKNNCTYLFFYIWKTLGWGPASRVHPTC